MITFVFAVSLSAQTTQRWIPFQTPSKASLRGLHAVSDSVAWASGANATVMRTTDAGASWKTFPIPGAEGLDFRDIHVWDAQTAVIMSAGPGRKSRMYRSTDGGATWILGHENKREKGFFDSIAFWDRKRGIVVGDPVDGRFTILTTTDGGASWQPASTPQSMPPANEGEGAFAASGTAIAVGRNGRVWFGTGGDKGGRVFSSKDWGRTWRVSQTPIRHDSASAGIFSVAFQSDGVHGFAVGGDYRKEEAAEDVFIVTSDGGHKWTSANGLTGFRSAIAISGHTVIATGPKGTDISRDRGRSWKSFPPPGFHAVSIAKGKAWASGSDGRVAGVAVAAGR